ncbi:hypothetical protein BJV74DRAFT_458506 [Russula compacta]|nr:hypothetical protein BJV74DRAFT_458506 [Russula compacta]
MAWEPCPGYLSLPLSCKPARPDYILSPTHRTIVARATSPHPLRDLLINSQDCFQHSLFLWSLVPHCSRPPSLAPTSYFIPACNLRAEVLCPSSARSFPMLGENHAPRLTDIPLNSTPEGYLRRRPSSHEDRGTSVTAAGGAANAGSPLLALAVGLLVLLWMWMIEGGAMLPARLRRGTTTLERLELGQKKNGRTCRCRVCMLRMQAQGQPLHGHSK